MYDSRADGLTYGMWLLLQALLKGLPFPGRMRSAAGFFFQAEDGIRDLTVTGVQMLFRSVGLARHGRLSGDFGVEIRQQGSARVDDELRLVPAEELLVRVGDARVVPHRVESVEDAAER